MKVIAATLMQTICGTGIRVSEHQYITVESLKEGKAVVKNKGKIREMQEILAPLDIEIVSQQELGIDVDVEETDDTFVKNALIKARAVAMVCDYPILADDSGICVEALGGAPGVRSARYAGDNATDEDRINKLLTELGDNENRRAKFVTSVAFIMLFLSDELGKTFAESSDEEKNSISHRGRALKNLYDKLKKMN